MVAALTFHTEYTPTVSIQLDTGAMFSAMSYRDLLNILQNGEALGENVRLYNGHVVEPLGS